MIVRHSVGRMDERAGTSENVLIQPGPGRISEVKAIIGEV
jgi:hypothetical protein